MTGLPATTSDDVVVHPRDQDLVLATHGRSFYILDDITPLQQLTDGVLAKDRTPVPAAAGDAVGLRTNGRGTAAATNCSARRPARRDPVVLSEESAPGKVTLQVMDASGAVVREFDAPNEAGIHRVAWDLRGPRRQRVRAYRPQRIAPGSYVVRMTVGGRSCLCRWRSGAIRTANEIQELNAEFAEAAEERCSFSSDRT